MIKILFVCTANRDRSPTAECIYVERQGVLAKSAGTSSNARIPLSEDLIRWADIIICMENRHKLHIEKAYAGIIVAKTIEYLDIPDIYPYMHQVLIETVREKSDAIIAAFSRARRTESGEK